MHRRSIKYQPRLVETNVDSVWVISVLRPVCSIWQVICQLIVQTKHVEGMEKTEFWCRLYDLLGLTRFGLSIWFFLPRAPCPIVSGYCFRVAPSVTPTARTYMLHFHTGRVLTCWPPAFQHISHSNLEQYGQAHTHTQLHNMLGGTCLCSAASTVALVRTIIAARDSGLRCKDNWNYSRLYQCSLPMNVRV